MILYIGKCAYNGLMTLLSILYDHHYSHFPRYAYPEGTNEPNTNVLLNISPGEICSPLPLIAVHYVRHGGH